MRTGQRAAVSLLSLTLVLVLTGWLYSSGRDSVRCLPPRPAPPGRVCAMHGYGWQRPGGRTLYGSVWSSETRWGNELSRYWQARGMARLGGLAFVAVGDLSHAWLRYLPKRVAAEPLPVAQGAPGTCAAFDAACAACHNWKYSHVCLGAWTRLGNEVAEDTRRALHLFAAAKGRRLPVFGPHDVVVHNRCSKDVWFWHGDYGPAAFSLYATLAPPLSTDSGAAVATPPFNITIVGAARQERGKRAHAAYTGDGLFPPCGAKLAALTQHLRTTYPSATVGVGEGWDAFEDFAHMAFAPVLVKDASSFSLWAGMSNTGRVISPSLSLADGNKGTFSDAKNWEWSNATVLYPSTASALGINTSDTEGVIEWLRTH